MHSASLIGQVTQRTPSTRQRRRTNWALELIWASLVSSSLCHRRQTTRARESFGAHELPIVAASATRLTCQAHLGPQPPLCSYVRAFVPLTCRRLPGWPALVGQIGEIRASSQVLKTPRLSLLWRHTSVLQTIGRHNCLGPHECRSTANSSLSSLVTSSSSSFMDQGRLARPRYTHRAGSIERAGGQRTTEYIKRKIFVRYHFLHPHPRSQ